MYSLVISAERVVTKNFLEHLEHKGLTKNIFNKSGAKSGTTTNMSYSKQTHRNCPLTLGFGVNFLSLTEPNPTDNLGSVIKPIIIIIIINIIF
jgi:hypothetical protein